MRTRGNNVHGDNGPSPQHAGYAIDDLRALGLIAAAGSLNAASKQSRIAKSVLSRAISKIETAVGGPVFDRTSSGMTPTAIGLALLPVAERAVQLMGDADQAMRSAGSEPQGRLDIAASALSGQKLVAPAIAEMARRYPQVHTTLRVTGRGPDPLAEDLDIVLRIGRPAEPHLSCRRLLASPFALYAFRTAAAKFDLSDPATVERMGRIVIDVDNVPAQWTLTNAAGEQVHFIGPALAHVGDPMVAIGIMNAGSGVVFVPTIYGEPLARTGAIARVMPGWHGAMLEIYAVMPARRVAVPAVSAFLSILDAQAERLLADSTEPAR